MSVGFFLYIHTMLLVLYCYYAVRTVCGLWVQLGDGRESPVDTSYPESYLKAATLRQDKVGQARPHSGHKLQHLITIQIISAHLPASFQVLCQVLLSLCGTEDTSKSTGCLQERNWFWQDTQDQEHGRYSNYATV